MPKKYDARNPRDKWRTLQCVACAAAFSAARSDAKYCSELCRQRTYDAARADVKRAAKAAAQKAKRAARPKLKTPRAYPRNGKPL